MTRLFHNCKCRKCGGYTQIANINVSRNICDDYICDSCKFMEMIDGMLDEGAIEIVKLGSGNFMLKIKELVPNKKYFFVWSEDKLQSHLAEVTSALE